MCKPTQQLDRLVFNSGINPEDLGDLPSGVPGYTVWVTATSTQISITTIFTKLDKVAPTRIVQTAFLATSQVHVIINMLVFFFLPLEVLLCGQLSSSAHITSKTMWCSSGRWTFRGQRTCLEGQRRHLLDTWRTACVTDFHNVGLPEMPERAR